MYYLDDFNEEYIHSSVLLLFIHASEEWQLPNEVDWLPQMNWSHYDVLFVKYYGIIEQVEI